MDTSTIDDEIAIKLVDEMEDIRGLFRAKLDEDFVRIVPKSDAVKEAFEKGTLEVKSFIVPRKYIENVKNADELKRMLRLDHYTDVDEFAVIGFNPNNAVEIK